MSGADANCWSCIYHQSSGNNFFGFCRWFVVKKNKGAKPIPLGIVDKGCSHHARASTRPAVPHYHTCRACADRHRWECNNTRCVWSILLDCGQENMGVQKQKREITA